jgi:hypothetical protein
MTKPKLIPLYRLVSAAQPGVVEFTGLRDVGPGKQVVRSLRLSPPVRPVLGRPYSAAGAIAGGGGRAGDAGDAW